MYNQSDLGVNYLPYHIYLKILAYTSTVKFLKFRTPKFFAVSYLKFKQRGQTLGLSKWCKGYGKQWRPWSDCSSRSSLIWVCTVCLDLSVRKLTSISRMYQVEFNGLKWPSIYSNKQLIQFTTNKHKEEMSLGMRKPMFCICENKDAHQLHHR